MFKQEFKEILHNHWLQIVLVALILIPSIYACIFLGSMWDPYGNSGDLPVAIVNEDNEVIYNDKKLHVGEELVNNLSENDSLDFHFVDAKKAQQGLKDGEYYMVVTIPENFSHNATTLLDEHPQKMVLNYVTNPGINYVAEKMSDTAVNKIKSEVAKSVSETYAKTLFESVDLLSNGLKEASDGSYKLNNGMNQLVDGSQLISDNLKVLSNSTITFANGAETLTQGLGDYTDGVIQVHNGLYTLKNGTKALSDSSQVLVSGVNQLNQGSKSLSNGVVDYTNGVSTVYNGVNTLVNQNDKMNQGVQTIVDSISKLQQVQTLSNQGLKDLYQGLSQGNEQLKNGLSTSSKVLSQQMGTIKNDFGTIQNDQVKLVETIKNTQLSTEEKNTLLELLKNNNENIAKLSNDVNSVSNTLQAQSQSLNQFQKQFEGALSQMSSTDPSKVGLVQASELTLQGINQLNNGLTDKQQGLQSGIYAYTQGVEQVQNGLKTIVGNNQSLIQGSKALNNGLNTMYSQTPQLVNGVSQLNQGAHSLYAGTSKLTVNNNALMNGSKQLSDGAQKIQTGSNQLYNGSKTLNDGLITAKEGSETLYKALDDGAKESQINHDDSTVDMMAAPVDIDHKEISHVENNGHAMAPYMMSVALYVVAMAFVLMYPIRYGIKNAKNGLKYWCTKATVMYGVSTLSAILMVTALRFINGFEPENVLMTYLFAIVVGAAFMSIVMLLSLTTGHIGEFILLVFMILNLGGSAGTYPLDTSATFFKVIHRFVPYTYSVDGFRKVISMMNPTLSTEFVVLIGIIVVCSILTIIYFQYKNKEDKHAIPEAFEKVNE